MKWSGWGDYLRSLLDRKARSCHGVPNHVFDRLCSRNALCGGSRVFSRCLICEMRCVPLARDLVCIFFPWCWLCRHRLPDDFRNSPCAGCDTCQPIIVICTSRTNDDNGCQDVVPNAVTIQWCEFRHVPDNLLLKLLIESGDPHDSIPITLSSTTLPMLFGSKSARQGVGGRRNLPR